MHRAQVLIEDWQYEALKSIAAREGQVFPFGLQQAISLDADFEREGFELLHSP